MSDATTVSRERRPRQGLKPQTREVLRFLLSGAPLTPAFGWRFFGTYRLSARIHELRRAGYQIQTSRERGYAVYRMEVPR